MVQGESHLFEEQRLVLNRRGCRKSLFYADIQPRSGRIARDTGV